MSSREGPLPLIECNQHPVLACRKQMSGKCNYKSNAAHTTTSAHAYCTQTQLGYNDQALLVPRDRV
jgi:hypothetical protein